jgi:regulator of protease activity HflC (stomatin/prohibitin superfamily)
MKKALMATLAVAALSLAACGQSVPAGSVGVKVSQYGSNAGVDPTPVGAGWHATGVGETYEIYPTSQKTYPYSKSSNEGSSQNEEIQFADSTGLPLTADVALTVRVDPTKAPALYQKYRMDIDDLIYGPLRMAVRSAVNDEAVKMTSEQIYSGGKTQLLALALTDLQKRYSAEGIEIIGLDWIGNVRFPDSVIQTITLKTTKQQQAEAALADKAQAEAEGAATVAKAQADAQALAIRGAAIRQNPQVLQEQWIQKWNGELPTYMAGNGNGTLMVSPQK